jgi:hypothetical protein
MLQIEFFTLVIFNLILSSFTSFSLTSNNDNKMLAKQINKKKHSTIFFMLKMIDESQD